MVAQLDAHNDDAHSATKNDPTFPQARDGIVNLDIHGCSNERHQILSDYAVQRVAYRLQHTYGETVFDGYSLARQVYRAALEIARESEYGATELEREYQLEPKSRDDFGAMTAPVSSRELMQ